MTPKERIKRMLENATRAEIEYGIHWYARASERARELAKEFEISYETACALIAVLSPNNSWRGNLKDARRVLEARRLNALDKVHVSTYRKNLEKAKRLLRGERPEQVLKGPKVWAFFLNISDESAQAVTVDFHIANLCRGEYKPMKDSIEPSAREYREFSRAIDETARERGLLPQAVQAIAWVAWKRVNSSKSSQGQLAFSN